MDKKQNSKDTEYENRTNTEPHQQPAHYINENNNNENMDNIQAGEPNVERANNTGIGDSGRNDEKLTNYNANHSTDA